ncbi:MAG: carboxypeptidase regulatory-like domain-containing protein [Bacteroidetes bacterium]|nr:carboxypeptidase regulatory-like domain-containing protein [Bacteroidota bacterium]
MLKKFYAALLVALTAGTVAMAQSGTLKGKVVDEGNGEGISFANVQLEQGGNAVAKTIADIDGNFTIKPLPPGKYDLKAAAVGFQTLIIDGLIIGSDKTTYQDMKVKTTSSELPEFVKIEYTEPLIDPDTKSGGTVTREEFQAMPSKNINSVAATTAGVFQKDEGSKLNVRGGRSTDPNKNDVNAGDLSGTVYYIDGQKVRGTAGLPQSSIEQVSVITGGVPAQYGDATGGVINITTRGGIRPEYFGGVELISSQFTDAYGYNFAGLNIGGPLMAKKDSAGNKNAKVGFFLSGEVTSEKDPSPSAVGIYKVKDDKLKELEENPLKLSESGGTLLNSEYLRMGDLEHIKARQNVKKNSFRLDGKLDFKATNNITLTVGGSMDYGNYHDFTLEYALLNPSNNPQYIYNTNRVYGKLTHKLGHAVSKDDKSTSLIQNAYYTLQVDYTKFKQTRQDDTHKDKLFNYGYIGQFITHKVPLYSKVIDTTAAPGMDTIYEQVAWSDTLVDFSTSTYGDLNPLSSNFTSQYYDLVPGNPKTLTDITAGYGLQNGERPRNVYGIWYNSGRQYNGYYNMDNSQLRVTGNFSADVKNHAIQVGFEWEKRDDKYWSVAPIGLWGLMRQLANKQITQLDTLLVQNNDPSIMLTSGSVINPAYPVYTHPYIVDLASQSQFDKSLRKELGITDNQKWIDIDSYDPGTYSIDMFSADELLNDGSPYVTYYGYDYKGEKLSGKSAFDMAALENFYKEKDGDGNHVRTIPSFQPVYTAGYIQDKFDIKDMKINVGIRIDHFNANQPVLADKYLLNEAYTISEDKSVFPANMSSHPANLPADAVVYVDDAKNPTAVLGYRAGDQWYNAQGVLISDPDVVIATPSSTGTIQPMLKYPNEKFLDSSAVNKVFKMYDAQNTFMPRVAFAFPISDKANFFAHYDVLAQRPPAYLRFDPTDYLYIQTVGGLLNNPGLKPERTTDYEVGFTQVLDERQTSSLSLSAFYREMRDMIQQIKLIDAYPKSYNTFGNIDFGTVKGFTVAYDLRRTGGVQMTASYTLQFAEGTGSASNTAGGILESGQPNLRTTMPLDFDQRHAIVLNADYRFGSGKDYRGPNAKWAKMIFENFGGNLVFRAGSGLPYTRQKNVTSGNGDNSSAVLFTINQRTSLKGNINGSNLPWQNRVDLRLDKNIPLKWGGEGDKARISNLNVYVLVFNVLNTQNVMNLYRYTGDPMDDGYLQAPENQNSIAAATDPQSFKDLYNIKMANPTHYSIPRRIRIGITLDF